MSSYFYSGQIRRFLTQFIRVLNNFEVNLGRDSNGIQSLLRVPIYYGDSSRQVAAILNKNSENSLPTVPAMGVYINALVYDRPRLQEPQHISKVRFRERAYDPATGDFSQLQGDLLTVERLMPVPYLLTLKVDIWTSNTDQKLQMLEQIAVLFNPSLELQSSDSYVDWTSLSYITLTDVNFTSRAVPIGTEEPIDVATLTFELPIWLSPPAKVKRQGVIQKILANVYDSMGTIDKQNSTFDIDGSIFVTRRIYTPINLNVVYLGNTLKLYVSDSEIAFDDGVEPSLRPGDWTVAIRSFGELSGASNNVDLLQNGISQVRLENDGATIVGTVSYHPTDPSLLIYNVDIDTMPVNTLTPITAIIDPQNITVDSALLYPAIGTRYLILSDIGAVENDDGNAYTIDGAPVWNRLGQPQLIAQANDIIEWDGQKWSVDFISQLNIDIEYVTNLKTGIQYQWKNQQWTKSVEGRYGVGAWSFVPT